MPPAEGGAVLVLGDLGHFHEDPFRQELWHAFGRDLERRGVHPAVLSVCPPSRLPRAVRHRWRCWYWDRVAPPGHPRSKAERKKRAKRLLALLARGVRIEPGLLRGVRCLLPGSAADVETELDAWSDEELVANRSMRVLELAPDRRQELLASARELAPALVERAEALMAEWHADHTPALRSEESLDSEDAERAESAGAALRALIRFLLQNGPADLRTELGAWLSRWEARRDDHDFRNRLCAAIWACQHVTPDRSGFDEPPPAGVRLRDIAWVLRGHGPVREAVLFQRGNELHVLDGEASSEIRSSGGAPLASLSYRHPLVKVSALEGSHRRTDKLKIGQSECVSLPAHGTLEVETAGEAVELITVQRPPWARSCKRATDGLWVEADLPVVGPCAIPWPDQIEGWGHDRYGVWADVPLAEGVGIRLRWIPPGNFVMGSPAGEQGRDEDEGPQHTVTITRGFWLAETPCTQAQWQAVMGENPSDFQGGRSERRPVENVDWNACRQFCERLEQAVPALDFRLPTEAEWEYACRAGTTTAFNDGSDYTKPAGKDPALHGLGWFEENSGGETHPVGEKQPNAWGLYDMHGNVWEWCADGRREYADEPQTDPCGPEKETARRVVRGGCCLSLARSWRTACRDTLEPGSRSRPLGFRLAARPPGPSGARPQE